jgi:hypothetical protein
MLATPTIDCHHCTTASNPAKSVVPLGHNQSLSVRTGGLWAADLAGPFLASSGGRRWLLVIICVPNRYSFVAFLVNKSDAAGWLQQHFDHMVEQAATPMEVLRTDGGGEFNSAALNAFFAAHGVRRELTAPLSSFLNSYHERVFRTLRSWGGASLSRSGLGERFWPEVINHTNYVYLRLPTRSNPSPYQSSQGHPPSLRLVHPFGCRALVRVPNPRKATLSARSRPAAYLGPALGTKDAHRLLYTDTLSLATSRNVVFFDREFPFNPESKLLASPARTPPLPRSSAADETRIPPSFVGQNPFAALSSAAGRSLPPRVRSRPAHFDGSAYEAQRRHDLASSLSRPPASAIEATGMTLAAVEEAKDSAPAFETPLNFRQALRTPEREAWIASYRSELRSLRDNDTFAELAVGESPPRGRHAIPSRTVNKIKLNSDNTVERHKTRLVAKGFRTVQGVDYNESFAPTLRTPTFRALLATSCQRGWPVHQMDCTTAFLVPALTTPVYLRFPEHALLRQHFPDLVPENPVVMLKKALYGLVNSPREWSKHLSLSLRSLGFEQSHADPCLYLRKENGVLAAAIAVFVDDLAITCPPDDIEALKLSLKRKYRMTDGGEISWFLGVQITRDRATSSISLCQSSAIANLLQEFGMADANPAHTPAEPALLDFLTPPSEEDVAFMADKPYRSLVGSLLYLLFTRPDISFAVSQLSRFLSRPTKAAWVAALRVLRYLKGTIHLQLTFERQEEGLTAVAFADADFAGDKSRRSRTGFVVTVGNAAMTFNSTLQRSVTLSTCEAELMSLSAATQDILWVRRLLADLGFAQDFPTITHEDNAAALSLVMDYRFSARTKHVDIKRLFIHQHIEANEIAPTKIASTDNTSDIFTKPLGRVLFI